MPKFGALNNSIVGGHTEAEWDTCVREHGFLCFYCGRPLCVNSLDPELELVKDHLCPVSRGGVDYIWNIVPACSHCNGLKGNKMPGPFLRERRSFRQAVSVADQKSTTIPLSKARDSQGRIVPCEYVEVSPLAAAFVRNLSLNKSMEKPTQRDRDDAWYAAKRQQLRDQFNSIVHVRPELLGQMLLPFDRAKPVASVSAENSEERQA